MPIVADDSMSGEGRMPGATPEGKKEKKFSNKSRLFVGNLPRDFSGEELKKLFEEFGEVQEVYVQKEKNYGFVRLVRKCYDGLKCVSMRGLDCSAPILLSIFSFTSSHMMYEILLELLFTYLLYLPLSPPSAPPHFPLHIHTPRLIVVKQKRQLHPCMVRISMAEISKCGLLLAAALSRSLTCTLSSPMSCSRKRSLSLGKWSPLSW